MLLWSALPTRHQALQVLWVFSTELNCVSSKWKSRAYKVQPMQMYTQAVCGPTFHWRQWTLPTLGKKCSVVKHLFYLLILFPTMSLPNECLISFRCPAPSPTTFTHICIMYQEVTGRVTVRKRKKGSPWELHGTALSCMLNAEVDWSWLISQGNKRLCGSDGEGGWESIPQERPTSSMWGEVQQSDPEISRVGSNTPAHDSLRW